MIYTIEQISEGFIVGLGDFSEEIRTLKHTTSIQAAVKLMQLPAGTAWAAQVYN